jgi:hypothetical protein
MLDLYLVLILRLSRCLLFCPKQYKKQLCRALQMPWRCLLSIMTKMMKLYPYLANC